jgi:hypothetical protein
MRHPPESTNNHPSVSAPRRAELPVSRSSLERAPFEKWFPFVESQVDLSPFVHALNLLEQSPIRGEIFESRAELNDGILQASGEGVRLALERFELLPSSIQRAIIQELFREKSGSNLRSPVASYTDSIRHDDPNNDQHDSSPTMWTTAGRTLLLEGVLPCAQVKESLKLAELTLTLNASSPGAYEIRSASALAFVTSALFGSIYMSVATGTILGITSALNYRDVHIAREAIRGYALESLDTFETIRSGTIRDLGQTLNERYSDQLKQGRSEGLWRASGFAVARILRVFGRSPEDIFTLFLNNPCIHLANNPIALATRAHLREHQVPNPESILAPFLEESGEGESFAKTEELINTLNEVYFTRATCERERLRRDLARKIFESSTGPE